MFGCLFAASTIGCIVDHTPLWAWVIIIGAPAGAILFYFGPILLPIWRMIPMPIRLFLIGAGAAILAYLGGRYKGRSGAEADERARDAQAIEKRTEVDHDVNNMSESDAAKKLRDRWSRDQP